MIIAGFPCIGKTTMSKMYKSVCDLSSTPFHYLNTKQIDLEKIKGNEHSLKENPLWPQNYIDEVKKIKDKYKIIFIFAKDYILDLLKQEQIEFFVALPEDGLKEEYIKRARARQNTDNFILGFEMRYEKWRQQLMSQPVKKIFLKGKEYISDTLKRLKYFGG